MLLFALCASLIYPMASYAVALHCTWPFFRSWHNHLKIAYFTDFHEKAPPNFNMNNTMKIRRKRKHVTPAANAMMMMMKKKRKLKKLQRESKTKKKIDPENFRWGKIKNYVLFKYGNNFSANYRVAQWSLVAPFPAVKTLGTTFFVHTHLFYNNLSWVCAACEHELDEKKAQKLMDFFRV